MTPIQVTSPMTLAGQIDTIDLLDSGANPNTVISVSDPFSIDVAWSVSGTALPFLGGEWLVRAFVESIGVGFEGQVGPTKVVPLDGGTNYATSINVAAGTLPNPAVAADTVYKLVILVSHRQFGVKTAIAGFGESVFFEIQVP